MTAAATLAYWLDLCGASSKANNLLKIGDKPLYCITPDQKPLANGAITGTAFCFDRSYGFRDIGRWKIGADGSVERVPDMLKATLVQPAPPAPREALLPVGDLPDRVEQSGADPIPCM